MSDISQPNHRFDQHLQTGAFSSPSTTPGSNKVRTNSLFGRAGERVSDGWTATQNYAVTKPFLTVASAAVVGAGCGWLLPAGRRETKVMADVAHKVTDAAREAADTAVHAGKQQVDELAQSAMAKVSGAVVQAVMASGSPDTKGNA